MMRPILPILLTLAGVATASAQSAEVFERADRETAVLVLARSVPRPLVEPDMSYPANIPQRYVDVLCTPTSPTAAQRAAALVAEHTMAADPWIALWQVTGMVVRTDTSAMTMEVVDPKGGEIIRSPQVVSPEGQAALKKLKPGDQVTALFREHVTLQAAP